MAMFKLGLHEQFEFKFSISRSACDLPVNIHYFVSVYNLYCMYKGRDNFANQDE